jgi:hypothetical protein
MDPRISQLIAVGRLHDQIRAAEAAKEAKAAKRDRRRPAEPAVRRHRFVRRSPTSTTPTR